MISKNELQTLSTKFPLLEYDESKGVLYGYIEINDDDEYELEIDVSNFPSKFPTVLETGGRIPRKVDRHVNSDNTLCLTTLVMEVSLLKKSVKSIEDFLELILMPYLVNNSYYEINGEYKFGEYSHCPIESAYQSYQDILDVQSSGAVASFIIAVVLNRNYNPNDLCFCGSNKKIKKCGRHQSTLQEFQRMYKKGALTNDILIAELELIKK